MAKGCTHSRCVTSRVMWWWCSMSWLCWWIYFFEQHVFSRISHIYIAPFLEFTFASYSLHETIAMETTLLILRHNWLGSDHPYLTFIPRMKFLLDQHELRKQYYIKWEKKSNPEGKVTESAHPARFSPDDKFSRQRVAIKKRFGIYLPDSQLSKPL